MQSHRGSRTLEGAIGIFGMLPVLCSIIAGVGVLGWQCIQWLELAIWPSVTLGHALASWTGRPDIALQFQSSWLGLNLLLQYLINLPLAVWLIFIAPAVWFVLASWLLVSVTK
jgi:hypothetical protein